MEMKEIAGEGSQGEADMDKKDASQTKQGNPRNLSTQRAKTVKSKNIRDQLQYVTDLLDHVSEAIVASDAEYRLTSWNVAAEAMYGWKAEEVLGKSGMDVIQTIFPEADKAQMLQSIAESGEYRGEATQIRKDGTRFPVEVSSIVLRGKQGQIIGYVSINREITERKQLEQNLRENNERFQWAMEASQDGLWDWDLTTNEVYYSPAYFAMLGYPPDDKLPAHVNTWTELIHPDDRQKALNANMDCIENRCERFEVEFRMLAPDSNWKWILGRGKAVRRDAQGKALRMVGTHTDITERKQAEDALRESEMKTKQYNALLHSIMESPQDIVIFALDMHFCYTAFTGAHKHTMKSIWGVEIEVGMNMLDAIGDPHDREKARKNFERVLTGEHLLLTEEYGDPGKLRAFYEDRYSPITDETGAVFGLTVFVTDITERKQAEEALRENEANLNALIENTDGSIWAIDRQYGLNVGNAMFHRNVSAALGGRRLKKGESVLNPSFPAAANAEWQGYYDRALQGERFSVETRTRFREVIQDIEYRFSPIINQNGTVDGVTAFGRDITERKQAEEALRENEEKYRTFIEQGSDGITLVDEQGNIAEWNHTRETLTGLKREDVLGKTYWDVRFQLSPPDMQTPDVLERFKSTTLAMLQTGQSPLFNKVHQGKLVTAAGEIKTVEQIAFPIKTKQGYRIGSVMRDITERKQAEEALRESEERFHLMFEKHNAVMLLIEPETGRIFDANVAAQNYYGYPIEALKQMTIEQINTLSPQEVAQRRMQAAQGQLNYFVFPHRLSSGEIRQVEVHSSPIMVNGKTILFSITHDVTERKQAEEALRESTALLDTTQQIAKVGGWEWDTALQKMKWTDETRRIHGFLPGEIEAGSPEHIERSLACYDPGDRPIVGEAFRRCAEEGTPYNLECPLTTIDGRRIWIQTTAKPVFENEKIVKVIGNIIDITERKRAEESLRESEALKKTVLDSLNAHIAVLDHTGMIIAVNEPWRRFALDNGVSNLTGTVEKVNYLETLQRAVDSGVKDVANVLQGIQDVLSGARANFQIEYPCDSPNTKRWFAMNVTPLSTYQGGVVITHENITERKQAEEALQESEERFRSLYDNATVGMYRTTPDGRILMSNPAGIRMLGYDSFEDISKRNLEEKGTYAPNYDRISFQEKLKRDGSIIGLESAWKRKDGSTMYVRESATAVKDSNGNVLYYDGTFEDITESKRAEEQIEEQLRYLRSLHIIDSAINSSFNLEVTLKILVDQVISDLKVDAVSALLFNKQSLTLEYAASQGFHSNALQHSNLQLGQGYAGQAILERRAIHIPDLADEAGSLSQALLLAKEHFVTYYGVPLFSKGQIVGVIEILHRSKLSPTTEWENFLNTLAGQAAIAIDNAQMFENLQRSNLDLTLAYDSTIEGWSHAMDLRDRETEGHTQRVTLLTMRLAHEMNIPAPEIVHIQRGALLHDMGKMAVPDAILFKPGPLTQEEMDTMRKHPTHAYEMLVSINYLKPALAIPYCHHEKWNGTGYPQGLKREEIPLAARIFAIVDVWDALTSNRPYRPAWTREQALAHIESESGKHFDPEVVEIFRKLINV